MSDNCHIRRLYSKLEQINRIYNWVHYSWIPWEKQTIDVLTLCEYYPGKKSLVSNKKESVTCPLCLKSL